MKRRAVLLAMACLLPGIATAQYRLGASVVASTGGSATAPGISLSFTAGEGAVGFASSSLYGEAAGFWQPVVRPTVAVSDGEVPRSSKVALVRLSASPNPFSGSCDIQYQLTSSTVQLLHVSADVFDLSGRLVRRLGACPRENGTRVLSFDGRDDAGRRLPGGIYFLSLRAGSSSSTVRLVLIH